MRDRGWLTSASVTVWLVFVVAGCNGGEEEKPPAEKAAAKAKATVASVTAPTAVPTQTPEPTATPSPLPTVPPEDKEASAEDLELLGIVKGGASSGALIAFDGRQEIFRRGDAVFEHGTVKDVRDDSVIIRSGGKDVTLKIAEAPPEPTAATEPPAEIVEEPLTVVRETAPQAATGPLKRAEARVSLHQLGEELEKAGAKRVSVGGGRGLQLEKVEPGSFLAKLGLRNGDVLQKLNGLTIDDPTHLPDLAAAAEGRQLTVGFTRSDIGLTVSRPLE